jgi:hypothetical protein
MRLTSAILSAILLALLSPPPSRAQTTQPKSWPNRAVPDFGVVFNEDGDNNFPTKDQDYNRRYLRDSVDSMLGSGVRAHARCIGAGSDVLYYPTKVASTVGWRDVAKESSTVQNGRPGLAAGVEPLRIVGNRCNEVGIAFFPSVRMNDAHFARTPDDHQLTGKFWLDHRDLAMKNNRFDFSHEKVRQFRLDQIFEALDRYGDVSSGVQLDFNRHAMFFPAGQEREKAHLITEMIAAVREKLDQSNGSTAGRSTAWCASRRPSCSAAPKARTSTSGCGAASSTSSPRRSSTTRAGKCRSATTSRWRRRRVARFTRPSTSARNTPGRSSRTRTKRATHRT